MMDRLYAEQVKQFAKVAPLAMTATVVNASILTFVLRRQVPHLLLFLWLGAVFVITFLRLPLFHKPFLASATGIRRLGLWFVAGAWLAGLVWGAAGLFLFPVHSIEHQVFLAFVLGGMVAGATGTYSVMMPAFLGFAVPAVLPLMIRFFLLNGEMDLAMGFMVLLFLALMIPIGFRINATLLENFRLSFENSDLVEHLSREKAKVETTNRQLQKEFLERQKAEQALQESYLQLEGKVAERTRELAEANHRLEEDIAERHKAEQALRATNDLLERVFSTSFLKIAYLDREFNFIRVNQAYAAADGRSPDFFIGKNHFTLYPSEETEAIFRQTVGSGRKFSFQARPFIYPDHPERGVTYWDWELVPLEDEQGEVEALALFLVEVTDRIRTEEHLRQAQKMEAIGTLAGGIAHDFNNILNVIFGYSELTLRDLPEGSPQAERLEKVLAAAQRAADLVKQILAFSAHGGQERQPVRLQGIIGEAVNLLRGSLPPTIHIESAIEPDCPPVLANSSQMHQIIMNLGTNAYQAMTETGGVLTIELREVLLTPAAPEARGLPEGAYVLLAVSDTGHGMNPETLSRIFEPYYTTKATGQGTGLGLSIVHGIVRGHHGTVQVSSEPGKGTRFEILLPVHTPSETGREPEENDQLPTVEATILFIDDEEMIVELGRSLLQQIGCEVSAHTSSAQALETFRQAPERFDLVITDQIMPQLTGLELAQRIRAIRADIPVVLATGFSERVDEEQAQSLGIEELVLKPYTLRYLANLLCKILQQCR